MWLGGTSTVDSGFLVVLGAAVALVVVGHALEWWLARRQARRARKITRGWHPASEIFRDMDR